MNLKKLQDVYRLLAMGGIPAFTSSEGDNQYTLTIKIYFQPLYASKIRYLVGPEGIRYVDDKS